MFIHVQVVVGLVELGLKESFFQSFWVKLLIFMLVKVTDFIPLHMGLHDFEAERESKEQLFPI